MHAIERKTLDALPGEKAVYAGRQQLDAGLTQAVERRQARGHGVFAQVRDSVYLAHRRRHVGAGARTRRRGGIVGRSGAAVRSGVGRSTRSPRIARRRRRSIASRIARSSSIAKRARDGEAMTEFAVQQQMAAWFDEEGLVSDSHPVVAAQENAGDPHYLPTARRTRTIRPGRAGAAGPVGQEER